MGRGSRPAPLFHQMVELVGGSARPQPPGKVLVPLGPGLPDLPLKDGRLPATSSPHRRHSGLDVFCHIAQATDFELRR